MQQKCGEQEDIGVCSDDSGQEIVGGKQYSNSAGRFRVEKAGEKR